MVSLDRGVAIREEDLNLSADEIAQRLIDGTGEGRGMRKLQGLPHFKAESVLGTDGTRELGYGSAVYVATYLLENGMDETKDNRSEMRRRDFLKEGLAAIAAASMGPGHLGATAAVNDQQQALMPAELDGERFYASMLESADFVTGGLRSRDYIDGRLQDLWGYFLSDMFFFDRKIVESIRNEFQVDMAAVENRQLAIASAKFRTKLAELREEFRRTKDPNVMKKITAMEVLGVELMGAFMRYVTRDKGFLRLDMEDNFEPFDFIKNRRANCASRVFFGYWFGKMLGIDIQAAGVTKDAEGEDVTHIANVVRFGDGSLRVFDIAYRGWTDHQGVVILERAPDGTYRRAERSNEELIRSSKIDPQKFRGFGYERMMATIHNSRGDALRKSGQYAKARDELQAALKGDPSLAIAHFGLILLYGKARDALAADWLDRVVFHGRQVIALEPRRATDALSCLSFYYSEGGKFKEAEDAASQALASEVGMKYTITKGGRWMAGNLYDMRSYARQKMGMTDESLADCRKSIEEFEMALKELRPDDRAREKKTGRIYESMGDVYWRLADLTKGADRQAHLQKALDAYRNAEKAGAKDAVKKREGVEAQLKTGTPPKVSEWRPQFPQDEMDTGFTPAAQIAYQRSDTAVPANETLLAQASALPGRSEMRIELSGMENLRFTERRQYQDDLRRRIQAELQNSRFVIEALSGANPSLSRNVLLSQPVIRVTIPERAEPLGGDARDFITVEADVAGTHYRFGILAGSLPADQRQIMRELAERGFGPAVGNFVQAVPHISDYGIMPVAVIQGPTLRQLMEQGRWQLAFEGLIRAIAMLHQMRVTISDIRHNFRNIMVTLNEAGDTIQNAYIIDPGMQDGIRLTDHALYEAYEMMGYGRGFNTLTAADGEAMGAIIVRVTQDMLGDGAESFLRNQLAGIRDQADTLRVFGNAADEMFPALFALERVLNAAVPARSETRAQEVEVEVPGAMTTALQSAVQFETQKFEFRHATVTVEKPSEPLADDVRGEIQESVTQESWNRVLAGIRTFFETTAVSGRRNVYNLSGIEETMVWQPLEGTAVQVLVEIAKALKTNPVEQIVLEINDGELAIALKLARTSASSLTVSPNPAIFSIDESLMQPVQEEERQAIAIMIRSETRQQVEEQAETHLRAMRQMFPNGFYEPAAMRMVLGLWARRNQDLFAFDTAAIQGLLTDLNGDDAELEEMLVKLVLFSRSTRRLLDEQLKTLQDRFGIRRRVARIGFGYNSSEQLARENLDPHAQLLQGMLTMKSGTGKDAENRQRYGLGDTAPQLREDLKKTVQDREIVNEDGLVNILVFNLAAVSLEPSEGPENLPVLVAHEIGHSCFDTLEERMAIGGYYRGNLVPPLQQGIMDHRYFDGLQFDFVPFGYDDAYPQVTEDVQGLIILLEEAHAWWFADQLIRTSGGTGDARLIQTLDQIAAFYLDALDAGSADTQSVIRRAAVLRAIARPLNLEITERMRLLDERCSLYPEYPRLAGDATEDGALTPFIRGLKFKNRSETRGIEEPVTNAVEQTRPQQSPAAAGPETRSETRVLDDAKKYFPDIEVSFPLVENQRAFVWEDSTRLFHIVIAHYPTLDEQQQNLENTSYAHMIFNRSGDLVEYRFRRWNLDHYAVYHSEIPYGTRDRLWTETRFDRSTAPEVVQGALAEFEQFYGEKHVDYASLDTTYPDGDENYEMKRLLKDMLSDAELALDVLLDDQKITSTMDMIPLADAVEIFKSVEAQLGKMFFEEPSPNWQIFTHTEMKAKIADPAGLHFRKADEVVAAASEFPEATDIRIKVGNRFASARSFTGLLGLVMFGSATLDATVLSKGPDAEEAARAVVKVLETYEPETKTQKEERSEMRKPTAESKEMSGQQPAAGSIPFLDMLPPSDVISVLNLIGAKQFAQLSVILASGLPEAEMIAALDRWQAVTQQVVDANLAELRRQLELIDFLKVASSLAQSAAAADFSVALEQQLKVLLDGKWISRSELRGLTERINGIYAGAFTKAAEDIALEAVGLEKWFLDDVKQGLDKLADDDLDTLNLVVDVPKDSKVVDDLVAALLASRQDYSDLTLLYDPDRSRLDNRLSVQGLVFVPKTYRGLDHLAAAIRTLRERAGKYGTDPAFAFDENINEAGINLGLDAIVTQMSEIPEAQRELRQLLVRIAVKILRFLKAQEVRKSADPVALLKQHFQDVELGFIIDALNIDGNATPVANTLRLITAFKSQQEAVRSAA
ncbi:MAG: HPr family phosphocarrier protein [Candidatus Omnitrophica bacterium]|nr:HPr family phosphocarrier protein [Candidatus Omnitrophota bacterium]